MGAGSSPSSAFPPMLAQLRKYLDAEGRDPSSFPIGKRVYVAIDRPAEEVDRVVPRGLWPGDFAGGGDRRER
jgi:hypothetical protein